MATILAYASPAVGHLLPINAPQQRSIRMCDAGRRAHREWVEEVLDAWLPEQRDERCRLIDALVVAIGVYSRKLLRVDRGLSLDEVRARMHLMVEAILAAATVVRQVAIGTAAP